MSMVYHMVDIKALVLMSLNCAKYFKKHHVHRDSRVCGVCMFVVYTCVANNW